MRRVDCKAPQARLVAAHTYRYLIFHMKLPHQQGRGPTSAKCACLGREGTAGDVTKLFEEHGGSFGQRLRWE
jgi:hypothetical protein